ncbi:MAG TPA: aminotransferase class V-fold PLP-dependent enzyme [Acidimicrobiales bacterium]|nr:aminotransferase class V-fold PLP-dependent enzyme [Acidimicrobiales bacterium]
MTPPDVPEGLFAADGPALRAAVGHVVDALERWALGPGPGPCPTLTPEALRALVRTLDPCPDEPVALDRVLDEVGERILAHGVRPSDLACAAHLHSPTLLAAAATELAIGVTNQSMDSYDQAPAATLVEDHLVGWLAGVLGLPDGATGVLTAGGTASNLLGLLLARDHAAGPHAAVAQEGLPDAAAGWRIVTSAAAHFSVEQAAAVLGLGRGAVVTVPTDDHGRLAVDALDATLARLDDDGLTVIAVVGTAGTTDLGAVDPLAALAERAAARGAWFHVDAAVGGALCLSPRLRPLVAGLDRADSITTDLHKLWWQPIGASALLVRDPARFDVLHRHSDYLDRADDDDLGLLNLVGRSLDTSRRFDALKVLVSLRSTGRRQLAGMVEHLVDTAHETARRVDDHPDLELLAPPSTITVVFRWRPTSDGVPVGAGLDDAALDAANIAIQRDLFASGRAVLGRTRLDGRVALKFTLVNPRATADDLGRLADLVVAEGTAWTARPATPLEVVR